MEDFFKKCLIKVEEANKQAEELNKNIHIDLCVKELDLLINMIEGLDNIVGISSAEQKVLKRLREYRCN